MVLEPGEQRRRAVGEAGQGVGGVVLEHAEVDDEVDRGVVGPDVAAPVDPGLEDPQVGGGGPGRGGRSIGAFSSVGVGGGRRPASGLGGGDRDEQVGVLLDEAGEPALDEVERSACRQGVHGGPRDEPGAPARASGAS